MNEENIRLKRKVSLDSVIGLLHGKPKVLQRQWKAAHALAYLLPEGKELLLRKVAHDGSKNNENRNYWKDYPDIEDGSSIGDTLEKAIGDLTFSHEADLIIVGIVDAEG